MTYEGLVEYINNLPDDKKKLDVTIYVSGLQEFYPLVEDYPVAESEFDDKLDQGHPYLII